MGPATGLVAGLSPRNHGFVEGRRLGASEFFLPVSQRVSYETIITLRKTDSKNQLDKCR